MRQQLWSVGLQFARWRLCDKLEWLGLVESAGFVIYILLLFPFPRLDILLTPAFCIYYGSLLVAVLAAGIERTPSEMNGH